MQITQRFPIGITLCVLALTIAYAQTARAQCFGEGCAPFYPPAVYANNLPLGFFDFANTSGIYGWACDLDTPATPVSIHLYAGGPPGQGALIGAVNADSSRESAVGDRCGGYSNRGFYFAIPADRQHQSFDVYAYAIDTSDASKHTSLGSKRYTAPFYIAPQAYPAATFGYPPAYQPYYYPTYYAPYRYEEPRRSSRRNRTQTYTYPSYYSYPAYTYPTTTLDDSRYFESGDTRWCGSQLQYCGGTKAY